MSDRVEQFAVELSEHVKYVVKKLDDGYSVSRYDDRLPLGEQRTGHQVVPSLHIAEQVASEWILQERHS